MPGRKQHQVGAHVGQQVHVEPRILPSAVRRETKPLPLVRGRECTVMLPSLRDSVHLTGRPKLASDQYGQHLFGRDLQLGSEAAANVRAR